MEFLSNSLQEHLQTIQQLIESSLPKIEQSGQMICEALTSGRKILLCGNGGSAADAQHIAAELVGCYEAATFVAGDRPHYRHIRADRGQQRSRLRTSVCAASCRISAVRGRADSDQHQRKVEKHFASGRGGQERGCKTIALTGATADPLGSLCDIAVAVPSTRTSRVQEAHITIGHLWCEMVDHIS